MGAFDPSAMHVTRLAEADLGESVADTTAQISLIADGDVRQRCASAKLTSLAASSSVMSFKASAILSLRVLRFSCPS